MNYIHVTSRRDMRIVAVPTSYATNLISIMLFGWNGKEYVTNYPSMMLLSIPNSFRL